MTRRDRFLAEIEAATPWLSLTNVIAPHYPSGGGPGRPPVGLERILRMYIAQQCFGLSDEATEDALYDSQAIRRFVGIDLNREAAPDATTLLRFRHLLEAHQLTEAIFNAINAHLVNGDLKLIQIFINQRFKTDTPRILICVAKVSWRAGRRPNRKDAFAT